MTVTDAAYQAAVAKRRARCAKIIHEWNHLHSWSLPVSMVVLSCKRPEAVSRLLHSLRGLSDTDRALMEAIFVDNGSGPAVYHAARPPYPAFRFDRCMWNRLNVGMGPAINAILQSVQGEFVLFVEDDLVLDFNRPFLRDCIEIFREYPEIGHIRLKNKPDWDTMYPHRRIAPARCTSSGAEFNPWLPKGIHGGWSLGPVMFRWASWAENGPLPVKQGRGQAVAAEDDYAPSWNEKWLSCWPVDIRPFRQPETQEIPGFADAV